jgi:hypothetical protein
MNTSEIELGQTLYMRGDQNEKILSGIVIEIFNNDRVLLAEFGHFSTPISMSTSVLASTPGAAPLRHPQYDSDGCHYCGQTPANKRGSFGERICDYCL